MPLVLLPKNREDRLSYMNGCVLRGLCLLCDIEKTLRDSLMALLLMRLAELRCDAATDQKSENRPVHSLRQVMLICTMRSVALACRTSESDKAFLEHFPGFRVPSLEDDPARLFELFGDSIISLSSLSPGQLEQQQQTTFGKFSGEDTALIEALKLCGYDMPPSGIGLDLMVRFAKDFFPDLGTLESGLTTDQEINLPLAIKLYEAALSVRILWSVYW
jgi:hypothetical protein